MTILIASLHHLLAVFGTNSLNEISHGQAGMITIVVYCHIGVYATSQ